MLIKGGLDLLTIDNTHLGIASLLAQTLVIDKPQLSLVTPVDSSVTVRCRLGAVLAAGVGAVGCRPKGDLLSADIAAAKLPPATTSIAKRRWIAARSDLQTPASEAVELPQLCGPHLRAYPLQSFDRRRVVSSTAHDGLNQRSSVARERDGLSTPLHEIGGNGLR